MRKTLPKNDEGYRKKTDWSAQLDFPLFFSIRSHLSSRAFFAEAIFSQARDCFAEKRSQ
jgi:hypothetical protein